MRTNTGACLYTAYYSCPTFGHSIGIAFLTDTPDTSTTQAGDVLATVATNPEDSRLDYVELAIGCSTAY
ncbi:hypothetical protein JK358_03455 [Nocardia sp. 2]|uniref:Uncharacterized protein n=1 Tax=Nocardia acididurans TaxID=2802282 RepID=A0ABS1LYF8_9NOCA|nr:hypothetical protein [Nocardia acididurans]MBL1073443.1 hypothetical protein [Nocardia acididurans]